MIVTVTLNPAIDRLLVIDRFQLHGKNIIRNKHEFVAGKGFSVAKALAALRLPVTAIGFVGAGEVDWYHRTLEPRGIQLDVTPIAGTRINTKLVERESGQETELNEPGYGVTREQLAAFRTTFRAQISGAEFVVFSGSVAPGLADDIYAELIAEVQDNKVSAILDTSQPYLRPALQAKPAILRLNQFELEELTGKQFEKAEDIAETLGELIRRGPRLVLLSQGDRGAMLANAEGVWWARTPPLKAVNAVGAGDVMTAGLIEGLLKRRSPPALLQRSAALATASVLTLESGVVDPETAVDIENATEVSRL